MYRRLMTMRRLMIVIAIAALLFAPPVIGDVPERSGVFLWLIMLSVTNIPAIIVIPRLFGLCGARLALAIAACIAIGTFQVALFVPPNFVAHVAYVVAADIASRGRDVRDAASLIGTCLGGLAAGIAYAYATNTGPYGWVPAVLVAATAIRLVSRPRVRRSIESRGESATNTN